MGVHGPGRQGRLGICLPEATQLFFVCLHGPESHVGLRAGFAYPSENSLALGFGDRENPDCCLPPKTCTPKSLKPLLPTGLTGINFPGQQWGWDGASPVTVVSFGCAQQGCEAGKSPTRTP